MNKKSMKILVLIFAFFFMTTVYAYDPNAETVTKDPSRYSNYEKEIVSCGGNLVQDIPKAVPKVISIIYTVIQIAVPIILVVVGSIDLIKGVVAQKEDEIKKNRQIFFKRLITAAIIFLIFMFVKLIISLVADNSSNKILDCAECFIKNECDS